eukprot:GSMAST32.ASY1.ANO1.1824.1 assembled CDS
MSSFIAKKREMFLVQMSLDTKREEIRKLEEKAQLKEEALRKSELMLEEDAIRFDTFLKENDKKAHDAIKRTEAETKRKQEKIMQVKNEMSKLKELLELCEEYKIFLDSLTPEEYFQSQRKGKIRRKKDKSKFKPRIPRAPLLEEEDIVSSDEDIPMYFKNPNQLLDIFTALEESNLFLIQNSQETEQALEELRQEYIDTRKRMDGKTQSLKSNISELQTQIKVDKNNLSSLSQRVASKSGKETTDQLITNLNQKVRKVYIACNLDASANPSTLSMLTDLEGTLENLLNQMSEMDPEYVEMAEKAKEKERREKVRQDRLAIQQEEYEERLRRSMARAAAPVKKRKGKKIMKRSYIEKKQVKNKTDSKAEQAKRDEERYFS